MTQRPWPPPRMLPAQRHDARLDHRGHLMRTRHRHRGLVDQPGETVGCVAAQPTLHRLTRHPRPSRGLDHRHPLIQHLEHRCVSLLHQIQLHQHDDPPGPTTSNQKHSPSASRVEHTYRSHCRPPTGPASQNCHPATGATLESIYRDSTHRMWSECGLRTSDHIYGLGHKTARDLDFYLVGWGRFELPASASRTKFSRTTADVSARSRRVSAGFRTPMTLGGRLRPREIRAMVRPER